MSVRLARVDGDTGAVIDPAEVASHPANLAVLLGVFAACVGLAVLVAFGMNRLMRGLGNPYRLTDAQQRSSERTALTLVLVVTVIGLPLGALMVAFWA